MCPPEYLRNMSSSGNSLMADSNVTMCPRLMLNLAAHRRPVTSVMFNPNDETALATASEDRSIMLWRIDSTTNVRCYSYKQHGGIVNDIDYLHNGKLIASCSADKTVRLWTATLLGATSHYKPHFGAINSVAFSQNGRILTGASDKCSKEYDLKTQRFLRSYIGHNHWVLCSRYAPDTNIIASCSDDRTIRIWDARVQDNVHVFNTARSSGCKLAFNPSSTNPVIAVAMRSGSVRIYDLRVTRLLQHYVLHSNNQSYGNQQEQMPSPSANVNATTDGYGCNAIAWHPAGAYLLTGGADNTLCIVDTLEGRPVYTLNESDGLQVHRGEGDGHGEGGVGSVAFSADGEWFAAGGGNNVKIWKTNLISRPNLRFSSFIDE